ncbi:MAG: GatB/YqeY domain-containing protein [Corynebacterium sp.]|uniref:GatB/YqeY domain-containing protein n=1 Tax=uncultured Corynebacterium sp. TaxID=159447 RepID=UPI00181749A7|nr:GatB/YqeY domain-containing protein [uncultured Corynebacterium sp.]NLZ58609.1 GatB/YqeY domain-containing protein [Corynebacterium sp.]
MSDLKAKLREDLTTSMKARDKAKTGTLRMLLSALTQEETSGTKHELTDEDVLKVIAREIKKRRESAEVYAANDRQELADIELTEASILEAYQPVQLTDEELNELIDTSMAEIAEQTGEEVSMRQMGQVMKAATAKAAGRVDGKRLSTAVKSRISS